MIKNVKMRLALINTAVSGLILSIVVLAAAMFGDQSDDRKRENLFDSQLMTLYQKLLYDSRVEHSWLNDLELDNRLIIHIEENNAPLLYAGAYAPATDRDILVERAQKAARGEHVDTSVCPVSSSLLKSSLLSIEGDHKDSYRGMVLVFRGESGHLSITLLEDVTGQRRALFLRRLLFVLADISGVVCLFFVNLFLMGRALKPVEENEKRQQAFIAAAAHELRSPLAVIRSSAQAVCTDDPSAKRFLTVIEGECARMSRLIGELLLLTAAKSGARTAAKEAVDMDTLLLDLYERYLPLCREKGHFLRLSLPEEALPNVSGDAEYLSRILSILLDNAIAYSPGDTEICLAASVNDMAAAHSHLPHRRLTAISPDRKKNCLLLSVADHGPGIPPKDRERIFERFYRADRSRQDKNHFGLGLSVAAELVRLHGGTIWAGDAPGGGATLFVALPV